MSGVYRAVGRKVKTVAPEFQALLQLKTFSHGCKDAAVVIIGNTTSGRPNDYGTKISVDDPNFDDRVRRAFRERDNAGCSVWTCLNPIDPSSGEHKEKDVALLCVFMLDFDRTNKLVRQNKTLDHKAIKEVLTKFLTRIGVPLQHARDNATGTKFIWFVNPVEATDANRKLFKDTSRNLKKIIKHGCARKLANNGCKLDKRAGSNPCDLTKLAGSISDKEMNIRHQFVCDRAGRLDFFEFCELIARIAAPLNKLRFSKPKKHLIESKNAREQTKSIFGTSTRKYKELADLYWSKFDAALEKCSNADMYEFVEQLASDCWEHVLGIEDRQRRETGNPDWTWVPPKYWEKLGHRPNSTAKHNAELMEVLSEIGHKEYKGERYQFVLFCVRSIYWGSPLRGVELLDKIKSICKSILMGMGEADWRRFDEIVESSIKECDQWLKTRGKQGAGPDALNETRNESISFTPRTLTAIIRSRLFKDRQGRAQQKLAKYAITTYPELASEKDIHLISLTGAEKKQEWQKAVRKCPENMPDREVVDFVKEKTGIKRGVRTIMNYRKTLKGAKTAA